MRTLLSLVATATLLTVAAADTALAGKPVSGDCPFAGKWAYGSASDLRFDFSIGGDGALSGKLTWNIGGGGGGWFRNPEAAGERRQIATKYIVTYSGTVSNDGRMDATATSPLGTSDWDGDVSLTANDELVIQPDGASPIVLQRR